MTSPTEQSSIAIREIETIGEIKAVEDLQILAWGDDERDIVPLNQLAAARHVGGTLIGAFDGQKLVGFAYGFYGHLAGCIVHHSHMLAVDPAYRNHNLGFKLKAAQRERVLGDLLTDRMTWTYDPLQSSNAYFNFAKLRVVSQTYKVDVYGDRGTSFLHRNSTDRLFVTWLLDSPRVKRGLAGVSKGLDEKWFSGETSADRLRNVDQRPMSVAAMADPAAAEFITIEIPKDINSIERTDFDLAREWRLATRRVFNECLSSGFIVTGYRIKDEKTGVYLLERKQFEDLA